MTGLTLLWAILRLFEASAGNLLTMEDVIEEMLHENRGGVVNIALIRICVMFLASIGYLDDSHQTGGRPAYIREFACRVNEENVDVRDSASMLAALLAADGLQTWEGRSMPTRGHRRIDRSQEEQQQ